MIKLEQMEGQQSTAQNTQTENTEAINMLGGQLANVANMLQTLLDRSHAQVEDDEVSVEVIEDLEGRQA